MLNDSGAPEDFRTNDPRLAGTVVDESPIALLEVAWDENPFDFIDPEVFVDVTHVLQPDGSYVIDEESLVTAHGGPLDDGHYTFVVRAEDVAGNANEFLSTVRFGLDRSGPATPPMFSLEPLFDTGELGDSVTILDHVAVMGFADPSMLVELKGRENYFSSPETEFDGQFFVYDIPLELGENQITIVAFDRAGNSVEWTGTITRKAGDCVGPDNSGYEACLVDYEFIDIRDTGHATTLVELEMTGGLSLTGAELGSFAFDFYGQTYSAVNVGMLGVLTFDDEIAYGPWRLEYATFGPAIAPFWDDVYEYDFEQSGTVFWELHGSPGSQQLIVQWDDLQHWGSEGEEISLQVVLDESDNSIQFNYRDLDSTFEIPEAGIEAYESLEVGIKGPDDQMAGGDILYLASRGLTQFVDTNVSTRIAATPPAAQPFLRRLPLPLWNSQ